jgi:DnaJ-domain-containing protein 1
MDSQLIHEAYQARLRKYDPSKFVEYGPEFQELARERTNAIIAAYQHLTASINR